MSEKIAIGDTQSIEPDAVIDYDEDIGEPLATVIKGKAEPENYDLTISTHKGYSSNIAYHELTGEQMFSSETIRQALKQKSLELEGYCTDHDEWIWEEEHQCLNSRSCDIWQPKDGHIWADFAKEVF